MTLLASSAKFVLQKIVEPKTQDISLRSNRSSAIDITIRGDIRESQNSILNDTEKTKGLISKSSVSSMSSVIY